MFSETRIAPKRVKDRIDRYFECETISLRESLCEPGECLFLVVQPHVGYDVLVSWNVFAAPSFLLERFQPLLRQGTQGGIEPGLGVGSFE